MRYLLPLFAVTLLACAGPLSGEGGVLDRPGNGGGGGPLGTVCPPHAGLEEGTDQRHAYTPEFEDETGQTATWNRTVVSHGDWEDGTRVTVEQTTVLEGNGFTDYVSNWTATYGCDDDGAWLLTGDSDYTYRYQGGEPVEGWYEVDYDAYLSMPWDPEEGWTSSWTGYQTDSNGNATETDGVSTYTFEGEEEIETPAGTFDALLIGASGQDWSASWYIDADAGFVRSDTSWITEL